VSVDRRAVAHRHPAGHDVTTDPALGLDLNPLGRLDISFDEALDRDFIGLDVRLAGGAVGDQQLPLTCDRTLDASDHLRRGFERQFALELGVRSEDR